ncbi:MAG: polyamine aminopropyltransferase [Myxococcota bacterium]|nr:polyamine aminopropyltransferase [Myxococcota bacterium]
MVHHRKRLIILAVSMGVVAACGLVYQLAIGTVCTYLTGNSTLQFSLTIGLFMSAYGLGSFASSWVTKRVLDIFIASEIIIALLGGFATWFLLLAHGTGSGLEMLRVMLILGIGTLVGLEVPLLIRLFESIRQELRVSVAQMMGFDYVGALLGGLAFPLLLLPSLGLIGSTLVVALLNIVVAGLLLWAYRSDIRYRLPLWGMTVGGAALLTLGTVKADMLEHLAESDLYEDTVVYRAQTPYQKIVMTKHGQDLRLYLDGTLQFSSADEYRYHEALVHPAASRIEHLTRVLILGGGEGLALRELRKHPTISHIDLVDIDPAMTRLAQSFAPLEALNDGAFERADLKIHHRDAYQFVEHPPTNSTQRYDLIIVDLPDPHHESLAKLYSVAFYRHLMAHLRPNGLMAIQMGSPFFANQTFWGAHASLVRAGLNVRPYHVNVPSFGEWGFALAGRGPIPKRPFRAIQGRFIAPATEATLFVFPQDLQAQKPVEPTTLAHPRIVEYFNDDWRRWN